ncbi:MAG: aromatic amino acid lyase [Thermoanaerobaculia bacterium]
MYGVNTGFGNLASVRIRPKTSRSLQERLVLFARRGTGRAAARGDGARMLLLRANTLAKGHPGSGRTGRVPDRPAPTGTAAGRPSRVRRCERRPAAAGAPRAAGDRPRGADGRGSRLAGTRGPRRGRRRDRAARLAPREGLALVNRRRR